MSRFSLLFAFWNCRFNEEMMESLFGYVPADKNKNDQKKDGASSDTPPQFIQIIDPKKSQNLAILLKALNVTTEEVCDALNEGVFTRFHKFFFLSINCMCMIYII